MNHDISYRQAATEAEFVSDFNFTIDTIYVILTGKQLCVNVADLQKMN